ncbi:MAG TPA: septation protein IspZ [Spirochaetota bacterium]|nr:septation protein IspZ [Spirochaetota bacterium]HPS87223.1 septation protein IspZ [Spirochaetota bacterium]
MPLMMMLKQMLPGLLPLFIFMVADEIWGTRTGLCVAVIFGVAELIITRIKDGKYDRFIIFDTAFLVILGLISILLENDIFFKLKPALMELILCAIIAVSAFSPSNLVLAMSQRYMKNMKVTLNEAGIKAMKRMLKIILLILSLHTILTVYSAFYMSNEAWLFISGGLFYIIFAVMFTGQILYYKIKLWRAKQSSVENSGELYK